MNRFLLALLVFGLVGSGAFVRPLPSSASADFVRVFIQLPDSPRPNDVAAVRAAGGEVRHEFTDLRIISVDVPENALQGLERNPRFLSVEPVPEMSLVEDTLPWGVDRINAEVVWGGANKAVNVQAGRMSGAGVKVAIIDTGIAAHSDLTIVEGVSYVSGVTSYNDDNGHGTHVAGIVAAKDNGTGILGVAPNARLQAVKVLNSRGSGYLDDVAKGIDWSVSKGTQVINMSLSCSGSTSCDHLVLKTAVQKAVAANVVVVAAAGNSGSGEDTVGWPAKYDEVIGVAATTSSDARASFSSTGPAVDLAAPGASIYSTYPGGYTTMSGTSMAAPHVAGLAALLVECAKTNAEARSLMQSTALDLGSAGLDNSFGHGLILADAATATCTTSGDGGSGGGGSGGDDTTTPPPPPPAVIEISDGFESLSWSGGTGWLTGWSRSGSTPSIISSSGPQAGSYHLRLRANGTVTRTFSLVGYTNPTLTFWVKGQSWERSDGARVQAGVPGGTWTTLRSFDRNTLNIGVYTQYSIDLSGYAGQSTVYLRFQGRMGDTSDYFYVDAISIK